MKYLQRIFEHSVIYSIILKNDKLYRISNKRNIQREIKNDINDIRKYYTNDSGIWNLKGIERKTIEYYKKSTCGQYSDEALLRRIFELKNNLPELSVVNSSFVGAITTLMLTFVIDFNELIDNINQKINDTRGMSNNEELIRKLNNLKITSNVKMILILLFVIVISSFMISFINNIFNSIKNTPTIYLNQKEIKIIEKILEGAQEELT